MDYAAGAPLWPVARTAMTAAYALYGNPSSLHEEGRRARAALDHARATVALLFNSKSDEVIFTASGTESNVLALSGVIEKAAAEKGGYTNLSVVTTRIEHPSVLATIRDYEKRGVSVSYVDPRLNGIVSVEDVKKVISPSTVLVSIQYANSEIGVIQPISQIGKMLAAYPGIYFHTDACQAALWVPIHQDTLRTHLISVDASKMGGPRGVGALAVKRGTTLTPLIRGGGQEQGMRAGTEYVAGAVGFAATVEQVMSARSAYVTSVHALQEMLIDHIMRAVPEAVINGSREKRLPNNINVSVKGAPAELVVAKLDALGVSASTGTACAARESFSTVVAAIASQEMWRAASAVRLTLGLQTKKTDIVHVARAYREAVQYARTGNLVG